MLFAAIQNLRHVFHVKRTDTAAAESDVDSLLTRLQKVIIVRVHIPTLCENIRTGK